MKVLIVDDTLGNPRMVARFLQDLGFTDDIKVVGSIKETINEIEVEVIIVGGHWLSRTQELRQRFAHAYIIGRSPWLVDGTEKFYPWGNELRDPMLPIEVLIKEILTSQDKPLAQ